MRSVGSAVVMVQAAVRTGPVFAGSKEKGRRGKRQPMEESYQNLLNLQLYGRMAQRSTRMDAGSASTYCVTT